MHETTVDSKYKIVRLVGQGGMGAVYEARHLGTGRRVALKVITPSAIVAGGDMLARFEREARASGAIDSQHVVQVLDTGVDPATGSPYLVMEYLTGEDLQHTLVRCGALPVGAALRIIAQACAGLTRAHEAGIIHRDIKSANLFISRREGGDLSVKVLDFGIAKVRADPLSSTTDQAITRTGALLGSPLYMSPEQVLGSKDIDARTDVYSLGVTLYEALCGMTPNHECETIGTLVVAISGGRGVPIRQRSASVPRDVAAIVDRALALHPSARFQSAAEMLAAITELLPQGVALNPSMFPGPARVSNSDAPSPPVVRSTAPLYSQVPPTPSASEAPAAVATTATAFIETNNPTQPRRAPRWLVAVPAVAALLLCGAGFGIYQRRMPEERTAGPSTPLPMVDATAGAAAQTPSAVVAVASDPTAPGEVDAGHAASSPAVAMVVSSAPIVPTVMRPRPLPLPAREGVAPATARPNCDPPYTFNADGKKIWKRECL